MDSKKDEQLRTCWTVEGKKCPKCGGEVATDGKLEWCCASKCEWRDKPVEKKSQEKS